MNETRWVNPHQPQTLSTACILCYIQAVFALLSYGGIGPVALLILAGLAAGGFGIANEKKWGYALAIATAVLQLLVFAAFSGLSGLGDVSVIINLALHVLLVVLLVHPMSRSYQRIWFK